MCDMEGKKPIKKIAMKPEWKKKWDAVKALSDEGKRLFMEHVEKGIKESFDKTISPEEFERILERRTRGMERVRLDHAEAVEDFFDTVEGTNKKYFADKHLHVSDDCKFILVFKRED